MGIKKYMTSEDDANGLKYKEHKPGFVIKENSIKYWVDNLSDFPGWELFVPDVYIKKIRKEATVGDVERRNYIAFDTKYLLSVFRSLNEKSYATVLRQKFQLREARLLVRVQKAPLMVQSHFVSKIRAMYKGDNITSIIPAHLKKCRERSIMS